MDYREFSKSLRDEALFQRSRFDRDLIATELESAADAIETLLEERDAAVEDLRGMCWCCSHGKKYENGLPWSRATTCEHMRELGVVARSGGKCKCSHWEWYGQQKRDE